MRTASPYLGGAALALALVVPAGAGEDPAAKAPPEDCPEQCGAVLKVCFDEYRKRHRCLALADECSTACKAGEPVLDENGEVLPEWHPSPEDDDKPIRW